MESTKTPSEKEVRNTLDKLFNDVKNIEDLNNLRFTIDEYLDLGYNIMEYVHKYNELNNKE